MKPKTYNRNSLHYYFATTYGSLSETSRETDICAYLKAIFSGLIGVCVFIVLVTAVIVIALWPLFWLFACLTLGVWFDMPNGVAIILAMYIILTLMWLGWKGWCLITSKPVTNTIANSFVGHAYDSIHNKICFKIDFVGSRKNESV